MDSIYFFWAVYIAVWIVISVAWWGFRAHRFGVSGLPFYLLYRTTRLNNLIERIAAVSPKAWRTVWNIGIAIGAGSMAFIFYELILNLLNLVFRSEQAAAIQPIVPLPGLFVSFETFPYLVLALSIVVASHELSHGIASLGDHVPLKSAGLFFAHVLMGGFVEPDEEKLNQAKNVTKLRIFAAGSSTNILLGICFIVLLSNFPATIAPFYNVVATGVQIGSVPDNLPAYSSGLKAGDTVTSINGTSVSSIADLRNVMSKVSPGQVIIVGTKTATYTVKTGVDQNNASHAVIGISGLTDLIVYDPKLPFLSSDFPNILLHSEYWLSVVLVSVGLINMLPMYPFDGDKFIETTLNLLGLRRTRVIRSALNATAYALLFLNVGLSLFRFGFLRY
jgi:membrane-associated protease RseP (regulator of RpoE activity)